MPKREHVVWKIVKCSFFSQKEIHYLGHIILGEGILVDPGKGDGHNRLASAKKFS
jgi:hypothetical protein